MDIIHNKYNIVFQPPKPFLFIYNIYVIMTICSYRNKWQHTWLILVIFFLTSIQLVP